MLGRLVSGGRFRLNHVLKSLAALGFGMLVCWHVGAILIRWHDQSPAIIGWRGQSRRSSEFYLADNLNVRHPALAPSLVALITKSLHSLPSTPKPKNSKSKRGSALNGLAKAVVLFFHFFQMVNTYRGDSSPISAISCSVFPSIFLSSTPALLLSFRFVKYNDMQA
jgi:hypothetical protein